VSAKKKLKVIALVCERSVNFKDKLDASKCLVDCPEVHVIQVPCSGQIQPLMIEGALKDGADGVITTGCRIGDCHYREGNKFLRDRLLGERQPKLRAAVDRKRIQAYWLSALEFTQFRDYADSFVKFLADYTPAELKKPAKKSSAATE
jgi:F420-non-reducing hydrogenase iron-sulfur subunit